MAGRGNVIDKLQYTGCGLLKWASAVRINHEGKKKELMERLKELLVQDRFEKILLELIDTKLQLNLEIDKDEMYWEQKAKANWLKFGDKNTTFFHKQALQC